MSSIRCALFAAVGCVAAFSQNSPPAEFEVASIRPSGTPPAGRLDIGLHIDNAQLHCQYFSLKDYIGIAYKLKEYQISGPEWLASTRYDISAKLPAGVSHEHVLEMLQALLTDRFQLKSHRDKKEFPVYELVVAKGGPKMQETPPDPASAADDANKNSHSVTASGSRAGTTVNLGNGSYFSVGDNRFVGKKLTMATFADTVARFSDRPIVDMTNLKGNYDFTLTFTPEDFRALMIRSAITAGVQLPAEAMRALEGVSGDSLFTAIQTLGLKLEPRKAPIDVLVIDRIERTPTEN